MSTPLDPKDVFRFAFPDDAAGRAVICRYGTIREWSALERTYVEAMALASFGAWTGKLIEAMKPFIVRLEGFTDWDELSPGVLVDLCQSLPDQAMVSEITAKKFVRQSRSKPGESVADANPAAAPTSQP